jgi:hypothetical protein
LQPRGPFRHTVAVERAGAYGYANEERARISHARPLVRECGLVGRRHRQVNRARVERQFLHQGRLRIVNSKVNVDSGSVSGPGFEPDADYGSERAGGSRFVRMRIAILILAEPPSDAAGFSPALHLIARNVIFAVPYSTSIGNRQFEAIIENITPNVFQLGKVRARRGLAL